MNKKMMKVALSVIVMTMGSFGLMAMDNNMLLYYNPVDNHTMPRTQSAGLTGPSALQIENTRLLAQLGTSNEITSLKVENAKLQAQLTASTTEISILRELLAELRKANDLALAEKNAIYAKYAKLKEKAAKQSNSRGVSASTAPSLTLTDSARSAYHEAVLSGELAAMDTIDKVKDAYVVKGKISEEISKKLLADPGFVDRYTVRSLYKGSYLSVGGNNFEVVTDAKYTELKSTAATSTQQQGPKKDMTLPSGGTGSTTDWEVGSDVSNIRDLESAQAKYPNLKVRMDNNVRRIKSLR